MHPILFELGGLPVHTYGALGAVGFLAVAGVALRRARTLGIEPETIADLIFFTAILALLGSRLLFVWQHPEVAQTWMDVVNYRKGGLVFYGALLVGVPVGTAFMRWRGLPVLATWDVFATAMPLGHAITRVGCFFAGCCWGTETGAPWAVTYRHPLALAPHDVGLHPVQLYEATGLLVLAAITSLVWTRRAFDGQTVAAYLVGYAALRAVTELYRGDASRGWFLPELLGETLSTSQGISLGVVAVGLSALAWGRRSGSRTG